MAFFDQKIRTLFTRFDMDGNGKIEVDDFNQWSAKLAKIGGLNADRTAALTKSLLAIWNVYFLPADTNNDGSVEVAELLTHMKAVNYYFFILEKKLILKSFHKLIFLSSLVMLQKELQLMPLYH
jgi:Ca2+-binding EF-hand superfamily protein